MTKNKTKGNIVSTIQRVLNIELNAIQEFADKRTHTLEAPIEFLSKTKGKIIFSGIGKSALVAQKISATLNSLGIQSAFVHAVESLHGDLGIIDAIDPIVIISKSGESSEIKNFIQALRPFKNTIIAIVGNPHSFLAKNARYVIDCFVAEEACIHNLAPTTSTTLQLIIGDIIAVSLMQLKNIPKTQFIRFHPGGNLGMQFSLKVKDILNSQLKPMVNFNSPIKHVILNISENRLGATVVSKNKKIIGIITDGDIRRMLEKNKDFNSLIAENICTKEFKFVSLNSLAKNAFDLMNNDNIQQLVVMDGNKYFGIIHLHDLISQGIH
ncbi:MAG: KpsF/GutQ family sugar-phosphate isomerase [Sediminibacterium sp.]|nr:KpsF/GutQ family sugar-phosphate isomerase [Sediminibacterium sp.]